MRRFIRLVRNSYSDSGKIFEELLLMHLDSFYTFALRLTGNQHAAEDLVQEASLRAFRGFAKLEDRSRFKPWVFRILRNLFFDGQAHRHALESLEEVSEMDLAEDGEQLLLEQVLKEEIRDALECLPTDYRTTLWLFDIEGLNREEISEVLGCPVGTVGSRLYRARTLLRRILLGRARQKMSRKEKL